MFAYSSLHPIPKKCTPKGSAFLEVAPLMSIAWCPTSSLGSQGILGFGQNFSAWSFRALRAIPPLHPCVFVCQFEGHHCPSHNNRGLICPKGPRGYQIHPKFCTHVQTAALPAPIPWAPLRETPSNTPCLD